MLGRAREPLLPADHMADLHEVIINNYGKMIRRIAIRFKNNLIVQDLVRNGHRAAYEVGKCHFALKGNSHADNMLFATFEPLLDFIFGKISAVPIVRCRKLGSELMFTQFPKALG